METTKHTKGEWHYRTGMSDNFCEVIGGYKTNKVIAVIPKDCFINKSEAEANGRLIASAPELLQALNDLCEVMHPHIMKMKIKANTSKGFSEHVVLAYARKVIHRATEG